MAVRNYTNTASVAATTSGVDASSSTITVTDYTGFPTAPYTAVIEILTVREEVVLVTAVSGNTLAITRGFNGSPSTSHEAGVTFSHASVALDFSDANAHSHATGNVHGVTGQLVAEDEVQTLTNKTLSDSLHKATATTPAVLAEGHVSGTALFRGLNPTGSTTVFEVEGDGDVTAKAATFSGGVTATVGFTGPLVGNVTGNVAGNISGATGTFTGDINTAARVIAEGNVESDEQVKGLTASFAAGQVTVTSGGDVTASRVFASNVARTIYTREALDLLNSVGTGYRFVTGSTINGVYVSTRLYRVTLSCAIANNTGSTQNIQVNVLRGDNNTLVMAGLDEVLGAGQAGRYSFTRIWTPTGSAVAGGGSIPWNVQFRGSVAAATLFALNFTVEDIGPALA